FGNGMWTDETNGAKESRDKLDALLKSRLSAAEYGQLEFPIANNPSPSPVRDLLEAFAQQTNADDRQLCRWIELHSN
ncbi:MAG: hypothetical protein ABI747_01450, partial [Candidatus Moraniibacteriota bacterium]